MIETNYPNGTAAAPPPTSTASSQDAIPALPTNKPVKKQRTHTRAGFTTNKGQGMSKVRRKLMKASRKMNRGKA